MLPLKAAMAANDVRVYAAASMTNVISELAKEYQTQTGVNVITVFAGSSSLARQILNGAPADIYISANSHWVDYLVAEEVVDSKNVEVIAKNELVLIRSLNSDIEKFELKDASAWQNLLRHERIAIGQPDSVPAGIYAKETLSNLDVWSSVKRRTAPTNSVRVALALVERGEAPLGIVYKTDAIQNSKVTILDTFSSELHSPIVYPLAKLNNSEAVMAFSTFLNSENAKQIFIQYGFN
jgi:molybdate transport system substrate-binding protein